MLNCKSKLGIRTVFRFIFVLKNCYYFSPLYSYLSTAKGVNVRWALGCKAETEQSELTQVIPSRFYIGIATPKIGSFYFPNFEEELYRQDNS